MDTADLVWALDAQIAALQKLRTRIVEDHYLGLATEAQNRAGLEMTRAVLRSVGDPDPDTTIAFVGQETAFAEAQAAHLADGLADLDRCFHARAQR